MSAGLKWALFGFGRGASKGIATNGSCVAEARQLGGLDFDAVKLLRGLFWGRWSKWSIDRYDFAVPCGHGRLRVASVKKQGRGVPGVAGGLTSGFRDGDVQEGLDRHYLPLRGGGFGGVGAGGRLVFSRAPWQGSARF